MPRALRALEPHALRGAMFHVASALRALVSQVHHALRAMAPLMYHKLQLTHAYVSHVS